MEEIRKLAFLLPDMMGGGAERVTLTLMRDFVARGHRVDLLLLRKEGELLSLLPPEVRVIDLKARRIRQAIAPLRRYLAEEAPDAIQAVMWPLTIAAIVAHRLARSRSRLVLSDHTTLSSHYGHYGRLRRWLMKASIRTFYPLAYARIIVSEGAADDMAALSSLPRSSFEVIYNPVPAPPGTKDDGDEGVLWTIAAGGRILSVGNLKPEKNQALLVRAFARVARSREVELVILGEGILRESLQRLAADEGVADRVRFPGFQADPWPYYRSADLFVLSSDYEGYPLALIEAMRAGCAVVSTDCASGPREILDGGRFGALVPCDRVEPLAEAIEGALDSPREPEVLKARAEALSGSDTAARHLDVMIGKSPGRAP